MRKSRLKELSQSIAFKNHLPFDTGLNYARRIEEEEFRRLREIDSFEYAQGFQRIDKEIDPAGYQHDKEHEKDANLDACHAASLSP